METEAEIGVMNLPAKEHWDRQQPPAARSHGTASPWEPPEKNNSADSWISHVKSPDCQRINFCCFKTSKCVVICHSSPKKLIYPYVRYYYRQASLIQLFLSSLQMSYFWIIINDSVISAFQVRGDTARHPHLSADLCGDWCPCGLDSPPSGEGLGGIPGSAHPCSLQNMSYSGVRAVRVRWCKFQVPQRASVGLEVLKIPMDVPLSLRAF